MILTILFLDASVLQSGGLLSQPCSENDSGEDKAGSSDDEVEGNIDEKTVDAPRVSESPVGVQMVKQRISWSCSASEVSTDYCSNDDASEGRDSHLFCGSVGEIFDVFESIKELRYRKNSGGRSLKSTVTAREYTEFWKEARQNILECRRLMIEFLGAIVSKNSLVSDDRMPRADDSCVQGLDLVSFEQAYADLCGVYGQLLYGSVLIGLGIIVSGEQGDLPLLGVRSCVSCDASSCVSDDFFCLACGESVIDIPDDRRDFDQACGEIMDLLSLSRACKKLAILILHQLKDL